MNVVLLCVGAAKAGTSWLYDQLSRHPQCHLRAIKELHYFDAIEGGRLSKERARHEEYQSNMLARLAGKAPTEEQQRRLSDRSDWMDVLERDPNDLSHYLAYLRRGAETGQVVADITPAYATLPQNRLSDMAHMAPDVRVVYLLRDPVERLWSHVRMIAGRRDEAGQVTERRCGNILSRTISGTETQIVVRSDYASALDRLSAAVPSARLLVEAFEDMIAGPGMDRICDFLGISRIQHTTAPVHVGQPLQMTAEQRNAAIAWLAPQYEAAERMLGRRPEGWP